MIILKEKEKGERMKGEDVSTSILQRLTTSIQSDMMKVKQILRPVSDVLAEKNQVLMLDLHSHTNLSVERQVELVIGLMNHVLEICHDSRFTELIVAILGKIIHSFVHEFVTKLKEGRIGSGQLGHQQVEKKIELLLYHIIDSTLSILNLPNSPNSPILVKLLTNISSLVAPHLISSMNLPIIKRIYYILLEHCFRKEEKIRNISTQSVLLLTQDLTRFAKTEHAIDILHCFLLYLFSMAEFSWIRAQEHYKGFIWNMILILVLNFGDSHLHELSACHDSIGSEEKQEGREKQEVRSSTQNGDGNGNEEVRAKRMRQISELLNRMYRISTQIMFDPKNKQFYSPFSSMNIYLNSAKYSIHEFLRYFKTYIIFSISLAIKCQQPPLLDFPSTLNQNFMILELPHRNYRTFIFLEAITKLLLALGGRLDMLGVKGSLLQIYVKISHNLLQARADIPTLEWGMQEFEVDRGGFINQEHEIKNCKDSHFVRLIAHAIFQLRLTFQNKFQSHHQHLLITNNTTTTNKQWEQMIRYVIKIIRHLSSLKCPQSDPSAIHKLLQELQEWFMVCPSLKARNLILQELMINCSVIENKSDAMKVGKCVQMGSNILYGFWECIDETGVAIILKMMAGVKADCAEGKGFYELTEINALANNVFAEESDCLINGEGEKLKLVIEAIVNCCNTLLADLEQPKYPILSHLEREEVPSSPRSPIRPSARLIKMIEYLLGKASILIQKYQRLHSIYWNYLSTFYLALYFNRNLRVKELALHHLGIMVMAVIRVLVEENQKTRKARQIEILELYRELTQTSNRQNPQSHEKEISLKRSQGHFQPNKKSLIALLEQLKSLMPRINNEQAVGEGFHIASSLLVLLEGESRQVVRSVFELEEILVKECLFRVKSAEWVMRILKGMRFEERCEKNEEYLQISLLWSFGDHLRQNTEIGGQNSLHLQIWELLFKSVWAIGDSSTYLESKQSSLHIFTQILASAFAILPLEFALHIIYNYFLELVLLLIGVLPNSFRQIDPEVLKASLQNFIKLFKMIILTHNIASSQKQDIRKCLKFVNKAMVKYFKQQIDCKNTAGIITMDLAVQLLWYIEEVNQEEGFAEYGVSKEVHMLYSVIDQFIELCRQNEGVANEEKRRENPLNGITYKKRVKPVMERIQASEKIDIQGIRNLSLSTSTKNDEM